MRTLSGRVQNTRTLTLSLDQMRVIALGEPGMVHNRDHSTYLLLVSRQAYGSLENYVAKHAPPHEPGRWLLRHEANKLEHDSTKLLRNVAYTLFNGSKTV